MENSADDESDSSDGEYDEAGASIPLRRNMRSTAKPETNLPFSPKKTRTRRVFVIDSDQELPSNEELVEHLPTRRSTRTRKGVKVNLDTDAYLNSCSESSDGGSDEFETHPRAKGAKKLKKAVRNKASRPAYGHFRVVADLDYDSHSDEETAPLREHRNICEKCHRGPAHKLIQALLKKPKSKGKRRKTTEDEFEESGDEEEKLAALGGWVRW